MPISAVMQFRTDDDARKIYDAVIDEMGVRDNSPEGAIYHWAAPLRGGLRVCDLWQTREAFDKFAKEQIVPLTAKRGLEPPELEINEVYNTFEGEPTIHGGVGVIVECDGDSDELLEAYDEVNREIGIASKPPQGLIMHWCAATPKGIRVIDHWRSREDFDRFVQTQLGAALQNAEMPQPRIEYFDVYNSIDARVKAATR